MSAEQLAQRILAEQSTIDSHKLRSGDIDDNEFSQLVITQNNIFNLPFFIDDTPAISVSQIASRSRRLKRTSGLGLIIIDYIQLMQMPERIKPGAWGHMSQKGCNSCTLHPVVRPLPGETVSGNLLLNKTHCILHQCYFIPSSTIQHEYFTST